MGLGVTELFLIVVLMFAVPIYAAIKAFQAGDSGWGIGILVAALLPFGVVVAVAYLVQRRRKPLSVNE